MIRSRPSARAHWRPSIRTRGWLRIYSTNPLKRLNKDVKRRTAAVGIFPDVPPVIRLEGALLMETGDEWQVGRRYLSLKSIHKLASPGLDPPDAGVGPLRLAPVRRWHDVVIV